MVKVDPYLALMLWAYVVATALGVVAHGQDDPLRILLMIGVFVLVAVAGLAAAFLGTVRPLSLPQQFVLCGFAFGAAAYALGTGFVGPRLWLAAVSPFIGVMAAVRAVLYPRVRSTLFGYIARPSRSRPLGGAGVAPPSDRETSERLAPGLAGPQPSSVPTRRPHPDELSGWMLMGFGGSIAGGLALYAIMVFGGRRSVRAAMVEFWPEPKALIIMGAIFAVGILMLIGGFWMTQRSTRSYPDRLPRLNLTKGD